MGMLLRIPLTTLIIWCLILTHTLAAIDIDLVFEDNQKQSSSIENSNRINDESNVHSNSILSNSPPVPNSHSEHRKPSYYENIKYSLSRLKSGLYSLFSSRNSTALSSVSNEIDETNVPNLLGSDHLLHRSKRQEEEEVEEGNGESEEDRIISSDPQEEKLETEEIDHRSDVPGGPSHGDDGDDDDDEFATGSGSTGSGESSSTDDPTTILPVSPPVIPESGEPLGSGETVHTYRLTLIIQEPFRADYLDRNSADFKRIEDALAVGFNKTLQDLPGHRIIVVQGIHKHPDLFQSKVTLDLTTFNFSDNATLQTRILKEIEENRLIGGIVVLKKGFTFRDFQASSESCMPGEIQCQSNYVCLPSDNRCNGIAECSDESDENECPKIETSTTMMDPVNEDSPPAFPDDDTTSSTSKSIIEERIFRVDHNGDDSEPTDTGCEQFVTCADSDIQICITQQCDRIADCPKGDDEENCPYKKDCTKDEFMCDVTRCIPKSNVCNNEPDCQDYTDEQNCVQTAPGKILLSFSIYLSISILPMFTSRAGLPDELKQNPQSGG
uniref:Basement membrane-specific heparan sulfate proteoglycan core protein n=1 Tax=Cacopsylla melanoneura TaxID=428564 RepID=A0A8D8WZW3_9HEMI